MQIRYLRAFVNCKVPYKIIILGFKLFYASVTGFVLSMDQSYSFDLTT